MVFVQVNRMTSLQSDEFSPSLKAKPAVTHLFASNKIGIK